MKLKEHVRAVASFSLDPMTEESLEEATAGLMESIREAKQGKPFHLKNDIWNAATIFMGLERNGRLDAAKAYPVLRACIAHSNGECPGLRKELAVMFARYPNLNAALL